MIILFQLNLENKEDYIYLLMTVNLLSIVDCILLQADLYTLVNWYNEWQLIVNIVKSIFMPFVHLLHLHIA